MIMRARSAKRRTSVEEKGLVERVRCEGRQEVGEIGDGFGDEGREEVVEGRDLVRDDLDDLGVRVTEDGRHLTTGKVQDLSVVDVLQRVIKDQYQLRVHSRRRRPREQLGRRNERRGSCPLHVGSLSE